MSRTAKKTRPGTEATVQSAQIHKNHLSDTTKTAAAQAPKLVWNQQKQEIIGLLQMPTQYQDWGRLGKPCPAFPSLTAASNAHDIQRAVCDVYARSAAIVAERNPVSSKHADPLVQEIVENFYRMCAEGYVKGLRENVQAKEVRT